MGSRIDKFVRKRKSVKADRATELGIAGHQAASKALGNATGGWKRTTDNSLTYTDIPARKNDSFFEPGEGNLDVIPSTLFGKLRVKSLDRPGSHTFTNLSVSEEEIAKVNRNKGHAQRKKPSEGEKNNGN